MSGEGVRLTLKVPRTKAQEVREFVRESHLFDTDRSVGKEGEYVNIPVLLKEGSGTVTIDEISSRFGSDIIVEPAGSGSHNKGRRTPPFAEIKERLKGDLGPELVPRLPDRWERLGDGLVLKLNKELDPFKERIGSVYASVLGSRFVLVDMSGIAGELREPDLVVAVPPPDGRTEVVHIENGIRYRFDPVRIMFSSGNVGERTAAASLTKAVPLGRAPSGPRGREIVYDMFAGIGYFSIPLAKGDRSALVIASEKNPVAYGYLLQNIDLNGLEGRIHPFLGDCRTVLPEGRADRIMMGYVGGTIAYLGAAIRYLSPLGGIVHFHETVKVDEGIEGLFRRVELAVSGSGRDTSLLRKRKVKSYAPLTDHVVLDIAIGPRTR